MRGRRKMMLLKFTLLVLNIGFVLSHDIAFGGTGDDEDFYAEFTSSDEKPVKSDNVISDKQKGVVKIPIKEENGEVNSQSHDKVNVPGKVKLLDVTNIPLKNHVVTLSNRVTKVPGEKNKRVINKSENDGVVYIPVHNVNIPSKKVHPVNYIPSKNEQNLNAPSSKDNLGADINSHAGDPKDKSDMKFELNINMKENDDREANQVGPESDNLPRDNQVHHFILYLNKPGNAPPAAVRGEDEDVVVGKVKLNNGAEGYLIFDSVIRPSKTGEHAFIGNFAGYELRPQDVIPIKSYINDYYDKLNKDRNHNNDNQINYNNDNKNDADKELIDVLDLQSEYLQNKNNNVDNNRNVVQKYHSKYPVNYNNDKQNSNNQIDREDIIKLLNDYLQTEDVGDSHDDDLKYKNQLNDDREDKNRYNHTNNNDLHINNSDRHINNNDRHVNNSDRHINNNDRHVNNSDRHINNNDRHINNKEVVVAVNCQDLPNTLKTLFGC